VGAAPVKVVEVGGEEAEGGLVGQCEVWGSHHENSERTQKKLEFIHPINTCELLLSLSPSCATLVLLLFEVSVTEHPFYVLVGFLLGSVAIQLLGSLDDEIRGVRLPLFRIQAVHSRG
jgi:hypothetical protein